MNWKQYLAFRKQHLFTISIILIVAIISYGTFRSTIISSDDWTFIVFKYIFGGLDPIKLTDRRPFTLFFYYLLASVFGLQVKYYYVINFLILFLTALLVYALMVRVFPKSSWLGLLTALVYLVYPVDYSRTWLIMSYIRFWWLISLGAIWMLLEYVEKGTKWKFLLALLGIIIPLGSYEGQFGIIFLTGALVLFLYPKTLLRRRLAIFGSLIMISIAFIGWRFYIQPSVLNVKDSYVRTIELSPTILVERYVLGLQIFVKDWLIPIQDRLHVQVLSWILLYFFIGYIISFWVSRKENSSELLSSNQKISGVKSYIKLALIGGAYWVAGYIPVILLYSPSLQGNASRVNLYAILGASLILISGVALLGILISKTTLQQHLLTAVMIVPFLCAGVFVQIRVNKENQIAWKTQKEIWNGVFGTISNIREDTKIVIIIPGFEHLQPLESFPFLAMWELDDGAKVLYNNPNVGGFYYYKDIQATELLFTKNGFRSIPTDKIVPYKKLIFVYYEPHSNTVRLVENLKETLSLPFEVNNYNPHENIVPAQPSTADWRWLVQ